MVERGMASQEEIDGWKSVYATQFLSTYDAVKKELAAPQVLKIPALDVKITPTPATGIESERLARLVADLATPPDNLVLDHRLSRIIQSRGDQLTNGISWPLAEALAIVSLNQDGVPVRVTGQDVVRGAFSHRHFELVDQVSGEERLQIRLQGQNEPLFDVHNSPLSEYATLGFEYGYSLARPDCLTIWEAQFGDFANGAQIVIDQFIASAKEKWNLDSGLVLLLPHGLDGQGPEHSSARIERFLQLSQPETMDVVVPSTPANYFHCLRAQAMRAQKRPLALMGAKALLRHPAALSPASDFGPGTTFLKILSNWTSSDGALDGVVFCSGKIFYELARQREEHRLNVAVIRIEQLSPFPEGEIVEALQDWGRFNAVFLQEEPANMGSLDFVRPRLEKVLAEMHGSAARLHTVSRPASGSPAGSFHGSHDRDQAALIERALQLATTQNTSIAPMNVVGGTQ
jgi:2-oxoglutarate dehydrogenase E1 component